MPKGKDAKRAKGKPATKAPAKAKPEKKRTTAPPPEPAPIPTPPPRAPPVASALAAAPSFVKQATAAERKAALERLADEEELPRHTSFPRPSPPPEFVRRAAAAERKAAVEALARERVGSFLGRVPMPAWKKAPSRPGAAEGTPSPAPTPKPARAAAEPKPSPASATPAAAATPKRVVILDTNALMMQFQFHVNIEGELKRILDFAYEIIVPDCVMTELEELAKVTTGKDMQEARMALEFARHFKSMEAPAEGDAGILRLAEKLNAIVVTNDKLLRARLRAKDIPNIHLRSRAFLTLEGHVAGT